MRQRFRRLGLVLSVLMAFAMFASPANAQGKTRAPEGLGRGFTSAIATVNGTKLHYVRGGNGPPVILIHGFPQNWSEYHAIMPRLAKRFTVIAVDLRGIGGSAPQAGGYDAATMAEDVHALAAALKLDRPYVVGHDIGAMVAYAFVRRYPDALRGAMLLDAPIPGVAGWDEVQGDPNLWHAGFMQVPGLAEKLVPGRQADFLGYFLKFGKHSPAETAQALKAYASTAQLHAAFQMYRAFPANVQFNAAQRAPVDVPLFFAAGEKSPFAKLVPKIAEGLRQSGCAQVETGIIPDAQHYVVSDAPDAVAELIERHAVPRS